LGKLEKDINISSDLNSMLCEVRNEISVPGYWDNLYNNCNTWAITLEGDPFWLEFKKEIDSWKAEYYNVHKCALLVKPGIPAFCPKPTKSIINKLERKIIQKKCEISEIIPSEGAPIPKLNDLVRTRITCKYIDGVDYLSNKLLNLAEIHDRAPSLDKLGKLDGYFAQHLSFKADVLYREKSSCQTSSIICEIQIATELATIIWESKHEIYELMRQNEIKDQEWQWDPYNPQFTSNQLGHLVHLVDGLLINLRDKINEEIYPQKKGNKSETNNY